MTWQGNLIVFGSLILIIIGIVTGFIFQGYVARGVLAISILAGMFWVVAAFYIARAMNSDI